MDCIETTKQFIASHALLSYNDIVIIGLSGGPDSVFLLHLLVKLRSEYNLILIAAHLNHEWRAEADAEQEMCRAIAAEHNIEFISEKLSTIADVALLNGSKEEYARKIRRYFFEDSAKKHGAQKIALGHHAQDQQETFLIRLIRGTSLSGLIGIRPSNGLYIRPLLEINKKDIINYLQQNGINYAVDKSNELPLYLRNRLRSMIVPALQECDSRFDANFISTINKLTADQEYLHRITKKEFDAIALRQDNRFIVDIDKFFQVDHALHYRIILYWFILEGVKFNVSQGFFEELIRFLSSKRGGAHALMRTWVVIKKQGKAFIEYKKN